MTQQAERAAREALQPCPFCGESEAEVRRFEGSHYRVVCPDCAGMMYADSEAGAIAGWNTRALQSRPVEGEEFTELLDDIEASDSNRTASLLEDLLNRINAAVSSWRAEPSYLCNSSIIRQHADELAKVATEAAARLHPVEGEEVERARAAVTKLCRLHQRILTEVQQAHRKYRARLELSEDEAGTVLGAAVAIEHLIAAIAAMSPQASVLENPTSKAVERLCDLHRRMLESWQQNKPYSPRLEIGKSDLDAVLDAAVELERACTLPQASTRAAVLEEAARVCDLLADDDEAADLGRTSQERGYRKAAAAIRALTSQPAPAVGDGKAEMHHEAGRILADAIAGLRYIETHHGRLSGVGWDRVFNAYDALCAKASAMDGKAS